jgi:GxxExxY protein
MNLNEITSSVINCAISVHREMGPGLLESVYQACLRIELQRTGLHVVEQLPVPVCYRGISIIDEGFRLDMLVEDSVIIELKSVEKVLPVHKKQLLTYLRLAKKPLGLLINFNEEMLVNGITRIVNS